MFGAGAEVSYGLPNGGEFALNIFRQNCDDSKSTFKSQRNSIDRTTRYAQWLPDAFEEKTISIFGKKAFEDIIRSTIGQNKDFIIGYLNKIDSVAKNIAKEMEKKNIFVCKEFKEINGSTVSDSFMNKTIAFTKEFDNGDVFFRSNFFSALLMAYKNLNNDSKKEKDELKQIIISILQLLIGALGAKLINRLNNGIFQKKDDKLDIWDDLGNIIQLNYESGGMSGLEYLLKSRSLTSESPAGHILLFAQKLIEKIYSCVIDYKSLIDSNWMYLYHPNTEWSKFCKIFIFLLNVQKYIEKYYLSQDKEKIGYYDDVTEAVHNGKLEITTAATSNYLPLISEKINNAHIVFLNGSTSLWYDPYLNKIGSKEELEQAKHFIVPLLFTQSGTKPMISIDMSSKYVDYYNKLKASEKICIIGFGFHSDDEHINGIFRNLIDSDKKHITVIIKKDSEKSYDDTKKSIVDALKVQNESNISIISVDDERKYNGKLWINYLLDSDNNK